MPAATDRLSDWLRGTLSMLWREILKFGIIGAVAFVIDVGTMNLLRHTVLADKPTTAKVVSASVATVFSWLGNRQWTFRHRRNRAAHHEFSLFVVTNLVALVIGAGAIVVSHYGLRQESLLADNIANVIGIGLGTLFRFWAYRKFVFAKELEPASDKNSANTAGSAPTNSSRP
ncbi:MAG: GtrA family protein [Tetrasphaera sp.]